MPKVMVTIQAADAAPTLAEIQRRYSLGADEIDEQFGVVEVDPAEHVYTILVEASVASRITSAGQWEVTGPYANVRIEPFGPPREG